MRVQREGRAWRRGLAFGSGLAALVVAGPAAALQQPDGTTIPVGNSLQSLFDGRGEMISALNDAVTVPETFTPGCALTFEVLQRDAGYDNSFGWYNVTGQQPLDSELYEFLACTDDVGTVKQLDIKNDPNYLGGDIGFYQAAGPGCPTPQSYENIFYSEKSYNPDSQQMNPYIHLLTYNSTATEKAFYFAWEDKLVGNDNDFNDLTTFVTGITCSGGGEPCDTGEEGVCGKGVMQCQSGVLTCVGVNEPQMEKCDAFDNDCNGETDEGDICPDGDVCDKGVCVPNCLGNEFPCPPATVCNDDGLCVDPACLEVECPDGEKCVSGECKGPCEGVVCPHGQTCELGVCTDPCGAVTCDATQVCVDGICQDPCQCTGCGEADACEVDGLCIPAACVGVSCDPGEYCDATGACVDLCDGAVCPGGQVCQGGICVDDPNAGAGASGGGGPLLTGGSGNGNGASSSVGGNGTASGGGGAGADGADGSQVDPSGCGCEVPGAAPRSAHAAWLLLGLLGLLRRRSTRAQRK